MNIVRRVLFGLQATGVDEVIFMPDYFNIGKKATEDCKLSLSTTILDMPMQASPEDSALAAKLMQEMGVGSIIVLGGDGTNRMVAKGCGDVPLVPISTGTNNVFPFLVEGTIAGLSAGVVATGAVDIEKTCFPTKRLDIQKDNQLVDIALIDIAVSDNMFIGPRAIWDMSRIKEIISTHARPSNIGLSSIGGCLVGNGIKDEQGIYIKVSEEAGERVIAPIAPGMIVEIGVDHFHFLELGDAVDINFKPSILALDGEREFTVMREDNISVRLTKNGPRVIDIDLALDEAGKKGVFRTKLT